MAVEFTSLGGRKLDSTGKSGPHGAEPRAHPAVGVWTGAHSALVSYDCSEFQNSSEKGEVLFDCVSFGGSFLPSSLPSCLLSNICY